jgi:hypothetical protein
MFDIKGDYMGRAKSDGRGREDFERNRKERKQQVW